MSKTQITLDDIKEQYILERLENIGNYKFNVVSNVGEYESPTSYLNRRTGVINTLIEATDSDISVLGGGIKAVAMNITMRFLLPVDDEAYDGINQENQFSNGYPFIDIFREDLYNSFSTVEKITLQATVDGEEKHFVGAISAGFPIGGELLQRQGIGTSYEYTCYLQVAFLENALNSQDVQFCLDDPDTPLPYTTYSISRKNTLSANLYSTTASGLSHVFAENSTFGVDLALPAFTGRVDGIKISKWLACDNSANANEPHTLYIKKGDDVFEHKVIFGMCVETGAGIENASWQISFVPYIEAEDD